ncbi:MAG: hypothetical protein ACYDC6_12475 [Acidobacteriaceae bacterium]
MKAQTVPETLHICPGCDGLASGRELCDECFRLVYEHLECLVGEVEVLQRIVAKNTPLSSPEPSEKASGVETAVNLGFAVVVCGALAVGWYWLGSALWHGTKVLYAAMR